MKLTADQKKELEGWMQNAIDSFYKTLGRILMKRGYVTAEEWKVFCDKSRKSLFKATKESTLVDKMSGHFPKR